jgi:hypothetical protein
MLMFVPCLLDIVEMTNKCKDCTTSLFYILAPTYFGSSLPSSGSFLDPSELLEIQIEWVVYHIMYGYVACVPDFHGSVCCASQLCWEAQHTIKHRLLPKHVAASI